MMKRLWETIKLSFSQFGENKILKLSAALAYYTIFSIPGLLMVIFWVIQTLYKNKSDEAKAALYSQISSFVGDGAAHQIQETFETANHFSGFNIATTIAVITLIFGATSIFAEIQDSINFIWRLKAKPKKGRGWLKLILDRLLSFSMVLTLGFLLMVSLILNTVLDVFIVQITQRLPETQINWTYISNFGLTFLLTAVLFGIIYKVLPDARIEWKAVRVGAMTTAILFMVGKYFISYFLTTNKITTAYGAAGSVIVILLWVYYTSAILYFGASFTKAYATVSEQHIFPSTYAVWVEQVEIESVKALDDKLHEKEALKNEDDFPKNQGETDKV